MKYYNLAKENLANAMILLENELGMSVPECDKTAINSNHPLNSLILLACLMSSNQEVRTPAGTPPLSHLKYDILGLGKFLLFFHINNFSHLYIIINIGKILNIIVIDIMVE